MSDEKNQRMYTRFTANMRIQHLLMIITFLVQVFTGFLLTFAHTPTAQSIVSAIGGWEVRTELHHASGILMVIAGAYHIFYTFFIKKDDYLMMPSFQDVRDFRDHIKHYLGKGPEPLYDRYNWKEKFEYIGVLWGTLVMGVTGFILLFPFIFLEYIPYGWINLSRLLHLYEAILATLVVFIWHFYNVHWHPSWRMQKTWITGKVPEDKMKEHHPMELNRMVSGEAVASNKGIKRYSLGVVLEIWMFTALLGVIAITSVLLLRDWVTTEFMIFGRVYIETPHFFSDYHYMSGVALSILALVHVNIHIYTRKKGVLSVGLKDDLRDFIHRKMYFIGFGGAKVFGSRKDFKLHQRILYPVFFVILGIFYYFGFSAGKGVRDKRIGTTQKVTYINLVYIIGLSALTGFMMKAGLITEGLAPVHIIPGIIALLYMGIYILMTLWHMDGIRLKAAFVNGRIPEWYRGAPVKFNARKRILVERTEMELERTLADSEIVSETDSS